MRVRAMHFTSNVGGGSCGAGDLNDTGEVILELWTVDEREVDRCLLVVGRFLVHWLKG